MADVSALIPTRGERNSNPGNIVFDPHVDWVGQNGLELVPPGEDYTPRFAAFVSPHYGIRAIAKIIRAYVERDGCASLRAIITRWAPGVENNTDAYVADVASETGIDPDVPFDGTPNPAAMSEIVRAIIRHENGRVIYANGLIADAVQAAYA